MTIEEWHHPDTFETLPSESEAFRLVGDLLAAADPSRWMPTEAPNTHWESWPESGSL